jgi:hypothetical protein
LLPIATPLLHQIHIMKNLVIIAFATFFLALAACNNNQSTLEEVAAVPSKTPEDSLYNLVMDLHDVAMPKMGKLMGYQKTIQQQIDSLQGANASNNVAAIEKLKQLKMQLANAESQMNEWMAQFEPDPKMPTTEERANYFAAQQVKAKKMRDDIFAALDSAAATLKQ